MINEPYSSLLSIDSLLENRISVNAFFNKKQFFTVRISQSKKTTPNGGDDMTQATSIYLFTENHPVGGHVATLLQHAKRH